MTYLEDDAIPLRPFTDADVPALTAARQDSEIRDGVIFSLLREDL